jgi:DNA-binding NarL/FixJ family response regulator
MRSFEQRQEDALFRAEVSILRLLAIIERLTSAIPRTEAARAAVHAATDERAHLAHRLRSEGLTVRQIAARLDRTERQVYRLLNR